MTLESIATQISASSKRENEVRIIRANMNLDGFDQQAREALKSYFNPYKVQGNQLIDCHACLAGFDSKLYEEVAGEKPDECEPKFRAKFETLMDAAFKKIIAKTSAAKLDHARFSYFLLPFPSIETARAKFQDKLWGKAP